MRRQNLSWFLCLSLLTPVACDEDDGGDDSAGDSADGETGGGGEAGEAGGEGGGMTSSSQQTCVTNHTCINDACTCDTPGLEGAPCTDDDACVEECEICN
jgi:hypothetical protein